VSIQECTIFGIKAFILRTDGNATDEGEHPRTIIEIATDVKLRDIYKLNDGDVVEVRLNSLGNDSSTPKGLRSALF
jgi:riboflavin kinase, archaea type